MRTKSPCVAVLGGGQLARMLALAGHRLGVQTRFLDPTEDVCASDAARQITGAYNDPRALARLLKGADVLTFEFENIPFDALAVIREACEEHNVPVRPGLTALAIAQDRVREKEFARHLGCQTARFVTIDRPDDVLRAIRLVGLPAIIKTRRMGYDGKKQRLVTTGMEALAAAAELGSTGLIGEEYVAFSKEWSIIAARSLSGEVRMYPLVENRHDNGILRVSRVDRLDTHPALEKAARIIAEKILRELNYVGVLAIEFFERDGKLLFNEMAPRVHNSGHWTIDGADCSQFENHIRAILGLPLGGTEARGCIGMINLIGEWASVERVIGLTPGAALHWYGKEPKPQRKVGHLTLNASTIEAREAWVEQIIRNCKEIRQSLTGEA